MSVQAAKKQAEDLAFSDESLGYYEVDQAFGFLSNLERQMNPDDPKLQLLLGNPYSSHEEEEKVHTHKNTRAPPHVITWLPLMLMRCEHVAF